MRWPRCTGTLVATSVAGAFGTLDALRLDASLSGALGSGGLVAAIGVVPLVVAEIALVRWAGGRTLAQARARMAVALAGIDALALAWLRTPMLARFSDRELAAWLWAGIAMALVGIAIAIGEPIARRLARRGSASRVEPAIAVVLAVWIVGALLSAPLVRGLAAELRLG
ncbi:MAG TPA: hypothetical protein VFG69_06230 [Nannocystaceae bacterium]|nr:hypothetical protein [Nannocystaceae bacterium]